MSKKVPVTQQSLEIYEIFMLQQALNLSSSAGELRAKQEEIGTRNQVYFLGQLKQLSMDLMVVGDKQKGPLQ